MSTTYCNYKIYEWGQGTMFLDETPSVTSGNSSFHDVFLHYV